MARIYGEILSSALMTFDKSFSRSNGQPLDSTEIFYSLVAAQDYAKTDVAYVGQKIVVIETADEVTTVTHYGIEPDNSLKALGSSVAGDEGTIVVAEDGTVSLYGVDGLELTRAGEDGNEVAITYQPLYVNGKLTWVEPSATTVEGLAAEIEGLKTRISAVETALGDEEGGLAKDVSDINAKIGEVAEDKTVVEMIADAKAEASYDDTELAGRVTAIEEDYLKAADKTELQGNIDAVSAVANAAAKASDLEAEIARAKEAEEKNAADIALILDNPDDEAINSIKEFTKYIADHGDVATGLQTQITENKNAVAAEKARAEGAEAGLAADIATKASQSDLDDAVARIGANEIAIAGKAAQADLDNAVARISDNETAIAGKVDAEEGKGLSSNDLTDELLAKLNGISESAQVNVIDSVDEVQFVIDENKKLSLLDIAIDKVTGLQDALDGKADKGTTLAAYGITDAYTKTETETRIQEVLDGLSDTSETAASVAQALETYKTSNDARVGTIEAKIATIEESAQVNKIESVKVGDTVLEIVDKTVVVPVGAGLKASDEVTISEGGILGIGEVNVNKLVQTAGEDLILNGGTSV